MSDMNFIPVTIMAMLVVAAMVLQPIAKLIKAVISPIVYLVYITWVGILTASERSTQMSVNNIIAFQPAAIRKSAA